MVEGRCCKRVVNGLLTRPSRPATPLALVHRSTALIGAAQKCGLPIVKLGFSKENESAPEDPALGHQATATPGHNCAPARTRARAPETCPGQSMAAGAKPATEPGRRRHARTRARAPDTCPHQSQGTGSRPWPEPGHRTAASTRARAPETCPHQSQGTGHMTVDKPTLADRSRFGQTTHLTNHTSAHRLFRYC